MALLISLEGWIKGTCKGKSLTPLTMINLPSVS